ncbi:MAG: hypothetical protein GWP08_05225 [Nitrospiraceae bacterium]|nr:hypothetical protein [Nitrospiraceae bacterium]
MPPMVLAVLTEYYYIGTLAFCVGGALALWNMTRRGIPFPLGVITMTIAIYAGLVGSRLFYVASHHPTLLWYNFPRALVFWQGNLSWFGGAPVGFLAMFLVLKAARRPFWSTAGLCAPGFALSHAIARLGCLANGCCHGAPTSVPWAIYSARLHADVHPTQLYGMAAEICVAAMLQSQVKHETRRRYLLPLYGLLLGSHRFVLEAFRGTPPGPELIEGLRYYQVVALASIAVSFALLMVLWKGRRGVIAALIPAALLALALVLFRPVQETALIRARAESHRFVVVSRTMFADALQPWVAFREQQGFEVVTEYWDESPSRHEVEQRIRRQPRGLCAYIMIVGDCAAEAETADAAWHMPSRIITSQSALPSSRFVSDVLYGDLDGDGLPDVPVGRLPVRTPGELKTQIGKVISFEKSQRSPAWFRAVLWTGASGMDREMERIRRQICARLPRWLDVFALSGDETSPFSGNAFEQPDRFLEAIQEPAMLSVVVSHGQHHNVVTGHHQDVPIALTTAQVSQIESDEPLGFLYLLACDTGTFNLPEGEGDCLSEVFVKHPTGPIAAVASSTPVHPLTNYLMAKALAHHLSARPRGIGDYALAVQRQLGVIGKRSFAEAAVNDRLARELADAVKTGEVWTTPGILAHEALSYNLLGDPACPLHIPRPMKVDVMTSEKGEMVASGPAGGNSELIVDRLSPRDTGETLPDDLPPERRQARFLEVNAAPQRLLRKSITEGQWTAEFSISLDYHTSHDYIRFITYGEGEPQYHVYSSKPFAPEVLNGYHETLQGTPEQNPPG